jgi:hypothetical protein
VSSVKVAIIGGGVAGSTTALYLGNLGLDITLFERESDLISGPPFCHLHAGGNLYREISDEQCVTLLKQSIDFLRYYPYVVDYRPTVIVLPTEDKGTPQELLPRLELLTQEYRQLIESDNDNGVLGDPSNYYRLYTKEEVETLRLKPNVETPKSFDEWMIPVAKSVDLDRVQFPLIIVQEYGLNLFRLASGVKLSLSELSNIELKTNTTVEDITSQDGHFEVNYQTDNQHYHENFDYIINAAGFRTGKIDDMLGVECKKMVEFKAAYVTKWAKSETLYPEIIFHGERGTPRGMGQFTPYPDGHYQLHGMTHDITLYEDGLVANSAISCQPKLAQNFIQKIEKSWESDEVEQRTKRAIGHIAQYMPQFASADVASKPLFGAQQIPGDDPSLRVAEVTFVGDRYARCEIVKVSSVLDMVDAIVKEMITLGYLDASTYQSRDLSHLEHLSEESIIESAKVIAEQKGYPTSISNRNVAHP